MKDIECIHCETFFDCKGKATNKPCLNFKENKKNPRISFEEVMKEEQKHANKF